MDEQIVAPSQQRPTDSKVELERQFSIFAVLWALASLLAVWHRYEAGLVDPVSLFIHTAIAAAAVALLIRLTWTITCAALGLLHLIYGFVQMPFVMTTDVIWTFFGGAICISFLTGCIVHRSYAVSAIGLYRSFAPCLRIIIVLAIAALGIARLNWTFLRLESSPVVAALSQFRGDAIVPEWVAYLTVSTLLVVDLFLAVSLLIPSLRRFAVGFGSCYFICQALLGLGEARVMLPLILVGLYLFTSTKLTVRIYASFYRWIPIPIVRAAGIPVVTVLASTAVVALSFNLEKTGQPTNQQLVTVCYAVFVVVWLGALVSNLIDARSRLTWISLTMRNPLHYPWIGLFVVMAASPYLGLGTWGRFADFSGLETFGGRNNHLLIPQTYLIDYQTDLAQVVSSSDPYLDQLARESKLLTWFDLTNYLNEHRDTALTFIRGGQQFAVARASDITELSTTNGWIRRKLVSFRPMRRRLMRGKDMAQVKKR